MTRYLVLAELATGSRNDWTVIGYLTDDEDGKSGLPLSAAGDDDEPEPDQEDIERLLDTYNVDRDNILDNHVRVVEEGPSTYISLPDEEPPRPA